MQIILQLLAIVAALLVALGCAETRKQVKPTYELFHTPSGVRVEAPIWIAGRAEFPAALREIDRVVPAFVRVWGPIPLRVIAFRVHVSLNTMATFVGNGEIAASLNVSGGVRVPGLPAALGQLAMNAYPYRDPADVGPAIYAAGVAQSRP